MFTTAGNAGFKTDAKPLLKLPSGTGEELRAMVIARFGAPSTALPVQFLNPTASNPPPISAARTAIVATQRGICKLLLFMSVSLFRSPILKRALGPISALDVLGDNLCR